MTGVYAPGIAGDSPIGTITCAVSGRPDKDGTYHIRADLVTAPGTVGSWLCGTAHTVRVPEQRRLVWLFVDTGGEVLLDVDADVRRLRDLLFLAGELLTDRAARTRAELQDRTVTILAEERYAEVWPTPASFVPREELDDEPVEADDRWDHLDETEHDDYGRHGQPLDDPDDDPRND